MYGKYRWAAALGACVLVVSAPRGAGAELLYGLTEVNTLGVFESAAPDRVVAKIPITGLGSGEYIWAIDFRPSNGQLYGLAKIPALIGVGSNARLFRIHMLTGVATPVSTTVRLPMDEGEVGFDFNPVTDKARVVTTGRLNYRIDPDTGQMIDGDPAMAGIQQDVLLQPALSTIGAIGHSNNFVGTAGSTLYGIDTAINTLVRIGGVGGTPSPDLGAVTQIGSLGANPESYAGLDISLPGNILYATVLVTGAGGGVRLHTVDLTTGTATLVGAMATVDGLWVRDIAVLNQPVTLYALTRNHRLLRVHSNFPNNILDDIEITGVPAPEILKAIDFRPATGALYAVSDHGFLYTIDLASGAATPAGDVGVNFTSGAGMTFDPITGHLRVSNAGGVNLRIDLTTSPIAMVAAADLPPTGALGLAYSWHAPPVSSATLYATNDGGCSCLIRVDSTGITPLGQLPLTTNAGFDIDPASNTAYLARVSPGSHTLFQVDLALGTTKTIAELTWPYDVEGLAVAPPPTVGFDRTSIDVPEPNGSVTITVTRGGGIDEPASVSYTTSAGTAQAGSDFTAVSGTLTFFAGQTTQTITVPIANDTAVEPAIETFTVTLDTATLGALVTGASAITVRIADDDAPPNPKPTISITAPTSAPAFETHGSVVIVGGTAADDGGVVSVTWADTLGRQGTADGTTSWTIPVPIPRGPVPVTITVTAHDDLGETAADALTVTFGALTYVLAEGATGAFFDTDILLANPDSAPAAVTCTFLKEDGTTVTEARTLAPTSRTTVRVDEIPGLDATSASAVITADRPIVVERTMRWAGGAGYGAHTEKAVDGAAANWYFAEGSQGFFSTYLLLANPQPTENTATVEYLREGETPVTRTYPLAPNSRRTIDVGADADLVNRSFGMTVTFASPGVAERAMYFGADPFWKAGHESAGVTAPSTNWFLAEGATGPFFETFILLSNPQSDAADVTLTFLVSNGEPVVRTKTVPAHGRLTINIEQEDAALANVAVATRVASSVAIVAERAQYWPFTFDQWYEAHNSFGVVAAGRTWGLAEGRVGGPEHYDTYILLANPDTVAATVGITFLRTDGTTLTKTFTVPAQTRFNVATGADGPVPELANEDFAAIIRSDVPIAVERAMYASPGGLTWSAGTNATATRLSDVP